MKRGTIFIAVVWGLMALSGLLHSQEYKIIVNISNPISTLTKAQVSEIFLKKIDNINGNPAIPVDLEKDNVVRQVFTQEIHEKNISAIKAYWQKMIYSGRDIPPPEKASNSEVIAYVQENPNAIGYVSVTADTTGVKVVNVTE